MCSVDNLSLHTVCVHAYVHILHIVSVFQYNISNRFRSVKRGHGGRLQLASFVGMHRLDYSGRGFSVSVYPQVGDKSHWNSRARESLEPEELLRACRR